MSEAINTDGLVGSRYRIGMLVSLASIAMLFTSLSSAYIVRSGVTYDWYPIAVPRVMFGSTALLILSSISIEIARRKLKQSLSQSYSKYLLLTSLLGLGFLVSQLIAWRQLAAQGIYISSHPHSSFFYVLTGAHAVHIAGGLLGLGFLWRRSRRPPDEPAPDRKTTGRRRRSIDLLAFHGRSLDLPIPTPFPLEVTGEH